MSHTLSITLDETITQQLQYLAQQRNIPLNSLIQQGLHDFLQRQPKAIAEAKNSDISEGEANIEPAYSFAAEDFEGFDEFIAELREHERQNPIWEQELMTEVDE